MTAFITDPSPGSLHTVPTKDSMIRIAAARSWKKPRNIRSFWNLFGSNPVMDLIDKPETLPDFTGLSPSHLRAAANRVQKDYQERWVKLERSDALPTDPHALLSALSDLEEPVETVLSVAELGRSSHYTDSRWTQSADHVATQLEMPHLNSKSVLQALETASTSDDKDSAVLVTKQRLQEYKRRGIALESPEDVDVMHKLIYAGAQLESKFSPLNDTSRYGTKARLQDIYTILAVRQKQAGLLGYPNYVDVALGGRLMQATDITALHEQVAERARKVVNEAPSVPAIKVDLTPYLSLDGALQGLFAITRALFGVVVTEDAKPKGWDLKVRLFHLTREDTQEPIGSFYLDVYGRPNKTNTDYMGHLTSNMVYVACNISPPDWNDMPTLLRVKDIVSLWHEVGHVLQVLLADQHCGSWNSAVDIAEVVPQFMEHWIFEKPIIETIAHLSGTVIPEDIILELQQERRLEKAYESLSNVFYGELELQLYSRSSAEEESLVALQRRIAETYVPHNMIENGDLSPLSQTIESNGMFRPVAHNRYLMSELISADLFQAFTEADVSNQEAMRTLGDKFQNHVLAPGPTMDVLTALQEIRGKDNVSAEAYFKLYNL